MYIEPKKPIIISQKMLPDGWDLDSTVNLQNNIKQHKDNLLVIKIALNDAEEKLKRSVNDTEGSLNLTLINGIKDKIKKLKIDKDTNEAYLISLKTIIKNWDVSNELKDKLGINEDIPEITNNNKMYLSSTYHNSSRRYDNSIFKLKNKFSDLTKKYLALESEDMDSKEREKYYNEIIATRNEFVEKQKFILDDFKKLGIAPEEYSDTITELPEFNPRYAKDGTDRDTVNYINDPLNKYLPESSKSKRNDNAVEHYKARIKKYLDIIKSDDINDKYKELSYKESLKELGKLNALNINDTNKTSELYKKNIEPFENELVTLYNDYIVNKKIEKSGDSENLTDAAKKAFKDEAKDIIEKEKIEVNEEALKSNNISETTAEKETLKEKEDYALSKGKNVIPEDEEFSETPTEVEAKEDADIPPKESKEKDLTLPNTPKDKALEDKVEENKVEENKVLEDKTLEDKVLEDKVEEEVKKEEVVEDENKKVNKGFKPKTPWAGRSMFFSSLLGSYIAMVQKQKPEYQDRNYITNPYKPYYQTGQEQLNQIDRNYANAIKNIENSGMSAAEMINAKRMLYVQSIQQKGQIQAQIQEVNAKEKQQYQQTQIDVNKQNADMIAKTEEANQKSKAASDVYNSTMKNNFYNNLSEAGRQFMFENQAYNESMGYKSSGEKTPFVNATVKEEEDIKKKQKLIQEQKKNQNKAQGGEINDDKEIADKLYNIGKKVYFGRDNLSKDDYINLGLKEIYKNG